MSIRKLGRSVACLALVAFVPSALLRGQEQPPAGPAAEALRAEAVRALYASDPELVSNTASSFLLDIATHANPVGIDVAGVDPALRAQLGLADNIAVVVTRIKPESEAAKAGLQQYDIVLQIDNLPIDGKKRFDEGITARQGQSVEFHVLRKGKRESVKVTLPRVPMYDAVKDLAIAEYPRVRVTGSVDELHEQHYRIGVTLAEADDTLRNQLRLASGEGLVVTEVLGDSPAAKAGIEKHDVLIKLDGKRLTTVEAINAQIQEIKERTVTASLIRAGAEVAREVAPRLTKERNQREHVLLELNELVQLHEQAEAERRKIRVRLEPVHVFEMLVRARTETAQRPAVSEQIAELKKQLAAVQKALETLEASLPKAEEQKSEE